MNKNSLSDLFTEEDKESLENQGEKVLIFDGHNLAYRNVFTCVHYNPEDNGEFNFWKHLMTNSIFHSIRRFEPTKVIVAFDTKGSWRYRIYDKYKAQRKGAREKAAIDFDKFFPVFNKYIEDLRSTFSNLYVMEAPHCEADDIIAVLTREKFSTAQDITIISTDKDMNQLLQLPNVRQYDPIRGRFMKCLNPKRELDVKVLIGDKSDNIPSVKTRCGKATAEAIITKGIANFLEQEGDTYIEKQDQTISEIYDRNRKLIDFNYIPDDIRKIINDGYTNYPIAPINNMRLMSFFTKNRMIKHLEDWQTQEKFMKVLS